MAAAVYCLAYPEHRLGVHGDVVLDLCQAVAPLEQQLVPHGHGHGEADGARRLQGLGREGVEVAREPVRRLAGRESEEGGGESDHGGS